MGKRKPQLTFGADPEFCVISKGVPYPAWYITPGTKEKTEKVHPAFSLHADNVALEVTMAPADSVSRFISRMQETLNFVNQHLAVRGAELSSLVYTDAFSADHLKHPMAQRLGCDPDFCAYSATPEMPRSVPVLDDMGKYRFFGGHIHVGYDKELCPPHVMAQFMDLFVAMRVVQYDEQGPRRQFYGQAGLYRPKPYGVEYRTLSNFWCFDLLDIGKRLATNITTLSNLITNERDYMISLYKSVDWDAVREIINTENRTQASMMFRNFAHQVADQTGYSLA
jgi:hypothetical protein